MPVTAVFDCMVYLQGAAKANGPSAACLDLVEAGYVQLYLSEEIISEIREVLARPKIRRKFSALTDSRVNDFLKRTCDRATVVDAPPKLFALERDPKDAKYLDLAAAVSASFVVSRDRDLLEMTTEKTSGREELLKHCPKTQIVDPVNFLRIIEGMAK